MTLDNIDFGFRHLETDFLDPSNKLLFKVVKCIEKKFEFIKNGQAFLVLLRKNTSFNKEGD